MTLTQKLRTIAPFWVYCCLLTWWVSGHSFFWDTVQLASKHAHWYFDNNFQYFFLPENINSGHPPIFGIYLATCWKIFGKSLLISHLSILPFLLGIVWLLYEIGVYFGNEKAAKFLILLVLADPFFAGQSVLVSPDIVLIFAFLLSLFAILKERYIVLTIGISILGLISMRGMITAFGLYIWWVFISIFSQNINKLSSKKVAAIFGKRVLPFLPGGLLALSFLGYHYQAVGWIGYHPDSPWVGSFERVDFFGFLKNIGILGWRILDYGRIFILGGLAWLILQIPKTKAVDWGLKLFTLSAFLTIILTPSLLLHKGLLSHRYLLPITLSITLLFYHLCFRIIPEVKVQKTLFTIAFLGLLTGNLWVYPKQVAQGWDATLAHIPYYDLRQKMIHFIDNQNIDYEDIGTVFPNIGAFEIYDLDGRQEGFVKKDLNQNKYFLYSVVFNDVADEEFDILATNWDIVQSFESNGLEVILYKKKENLGAK